MEDNLHFLQPSPRQEGGRHTQAGHSPPVPSFLLRTKAVTLGPEFPLFILQERGPPHLRSWWQEGVLLTATQLQSSERGLTGIRTSLSNHRPVVSTQGLRTRIFGLRFKINIRDPHTYPRQTVRPAGWGGRRAGDKGAWLSTLAPGQAGIPPASRSMNTHTSAPRLEAPSALPQGRPAYLLAPRASPQPLPGKGTKQEAKIRAFLSGL